jgi:leader peptidase (prepilin peptidase)/N-methyltransferase
MAALAALGDPSIFPWWWLCVGLVIGSFLNVVIHRLPKMMERDWQAQCAEMRGESTPAAEPYTLYLPRSQCPSCGHGISALENIPVLSYLALRGRCSACKVVISPRYPVVELLAGVAAYYCASRYGYGLAAVAASGFVWALIAATFIDLDTQLLPDSITLPLLWAGLLIAVSGTFIDLRSSVIGAAVGYLSLWSVYWLFKLVTGKEGMGFGDFKLLAAIGAWTGWQMLVLVILMSSVIGALVGVGLIVLARHGRNIPIPFGPYLAAAGVVALFWGPGLTRYYLAHLFG